MISHLRSIAAASLLALGLLPGLALAQSTPSAFTSAIRYDAMGRVTGTIAPDPDGAAPFAYIAVRNTYDANGRPIRVEKGYLSTWQSESIAPSAWGASFVALQIVDTSYDSYGRKTVDWRKGYDSPSSSWKDVGLTQYSYDVLDRLECTAVRMNPAIYSSLPASACSLGTQGAGANDFGPDRITKQTYDTLDRVTKIQEALGTVDQADKATYTYLANSQQIATMTDARGYKASMSYDGYLRQVAWIFPSTTTVGASASCNIGTISEVGGVTGPVDLTNAGDDCEKYSYDRNGNRRKLVKRDGSVLQYQYNALNRMTAKIVPERAGLDPTHTRDLYYRYDARGLMTFARFDSTAGEGITTAYSGFGAVSTSTQAIDGTSRQLAYCYDANGNRTRLGYPDNTVGSNCANTWSRYVSYVYDGLNRPISIGGNGLAELKKYIYANDGSLAQDWTGNMAWGSTLYTRDNAGRLWWMYRNLYGASVDYTTVYGYNPAQQVVQESRDNDAYAWTAHYNIDRNYAANGLNQYTQTTLAASGTQTAAFCYDRNGNLTADGNNVYLYDVENRLVERRAQGPGNTNCASLSYAGASLARLRYDPMGRLYEVVGTVSGTTRFLNDGDALVAEYDGTATGGTGNLIQRYVHGADGQADDPIARYDGTTMNTWELWFMHADRQGSINATADTFGNPTRLFKYDEYGLPQSSDATPLTAANGARFLYTGQSYIADLGMYYYKARIYSPTLGRFLQTDPIGYEDQVNLYAYVGNDPVNGVDPTGMCKADWQCDGQWSGETHASSPSDLASYNDHFQNGNGSDYFVDPSESGGLEQAIDIGSQIQQSVTGGGVMSGIANKAYANFADGPQSFALPDKAWSFSPTIASEAGLTVGRFTGTITEGTMQVSTDGSYVVRGQMTLNLGEYNFNLDGRNLAHNAAIWIGGKVAGDGKTFVPIPTRTYSFTATGRYRP